MADLTEPEVRALARALDLPMTDDDAREVTHRLNAFIQALAPLVEMEDVVDSPPAPVDPDGA